MKNEQILKEIQGWIEAAAVSAAQTHGSATALNQLIAANRKMFDLLKALAAPPAAKPEAAGNLPPVDSKSSQP